GPVGVVREVRADAPDKQRLEAEAAEAVGDVPGHAAAPDLQVADEERDRDLVQLLGDQRVGELAAEGQQVIGRDRPGDSYPHRWGTLFRCRKGARAGAQWKESPQAQEPDAFGLSIVKPCVSIVS